MAAGKIILEIIKALLTGIDLEPEPQQQRRRQPPRRDQGQGQARQPGQGREPMQQPGELTLEEYVAAQRQQQPQVVPDLQLSLVDELPPPPRRPQQSDKDAYYIPDKPDEDSLAHQLQQDLKDRNSLRRAIVLKELLDPPLAVRKRHLDGYDY